MKAIRKEWIFIGLWFFLAFVQQASPQSKTESDFDRLSVRMQRLADYASDFVGFAKSHRDDSLEFEIAFNMHVVAIRAGDLLDAIRWLSVVRDNASCDRDRRLVKSVMRKQLDHQLESFELLVTDVNNGLSHTKNPTVSTAGTRLKEELRETRLLLQKLHSL